MSDRGFLNDEYFDQQVPFDFTSGFSGQWIFGPTRIDVATGDISNSTGDGIISGFNVGSSGFSGFSGEGFSGPSGPSGVSGFSGSGGTGDVFIAIRRCWMRS